MSQTPHFQAELVAAYDRPGPRYTSYPPATEFNGNIGETEYRDWARQSNEELIPKPLSLYFHLPFCSSICYYCACNKVTTKNKQVAEDYLGDLFREIDIQSTLYDSDREVRQLHWGGGTPGYLSQLQMRQLMTRIRAAFRLAKDDQGDFSIELDPRVVVKDSLFQLRDLGFNRISVGVQDFDEKVQIAVNRRQPLEITASVIAEARRARFKSVNFDLIYGLPKQSLQSFSSTLDKVVDLDPDRIALYNYAHLPHIFMPQKRIRLEDLPSPEEKLKILENSISQLTEAGYRFIGMDHFALPEDELSLAQDNGTLYRNFQGYTTHAECELIGLGPSAISQIGGAYSQNVKTLEEYYAAIDQGHLPVWRGLKLDRDDCLRREWIVQLICHFHVNFDVFSRQHNIDARSYFADELEQLHSMAADGLLTITNQEIIVHDMGRLLIRNICMVFDKYLQRMERQVSFSRTI